MKKKIKYFLRLFFFISFCLSTKLKATEFDPSFKDNKCYQKDNLDKKKFLSLRPVIKGGFLSS